MANYEVPGSPEVARRLAEQRYFDYQRFEAHELEQTAHRAQIAPDLGGAAVVGAFTNTRNYLSDEALNAGRSVTQSTLGDLASGFAEGLPAAFGATPEQNQIDINQPTFAEAYVIDQAPESAIDYKLVQEQLQNARDAAEARELAANIYAATGQPVTRQAFEQAAS